MLTVRLMSETKEVEASQPKKVEVTPTARGANTRWRKPNLRKCSGRLHVFLLGYFLAVTVLLCLLAFDRESFCKGTESPPGNMILHPPCRATDINFVDVESPSVICAADSPPAVTGLVQLGPCNFLHLDLKPFPEDTFCVFQNITFQRWRQVKHYETHPDGKTYVHVDQVRVDVVRTYAFKCERTERPYSQEYTGSELSEVGQKMEAVVGGVSGMFSLKFRLPYDFSDSSTNKEFISTPGKLMNALSKLKIKKEESH